MSKISKSKVIEDIKNLDTISSYDKKITDSKTKKCIITIEGNEKDMAYKKSFEETVLEFIKDQKKFNEEQREFNKNQLEFNKKQEQFNNKIESKLDVIESLPTIQKELSTLPKNKK